jgi:hypothetical protein
MKYILTVCCLAITSCSRSYTQDEIKIEYKDGYSLKGTVWGDDQIGDIHKKANNKTWSNLKKELRYNK